VLGPLGHHVADDFHAAFFGSLVRPFAARCFGAAHVGLGATQHAHGHQHAGFGQFVHGRGVHQPREQAAQTGAERCRRQANHCRSAVRDVVNPRRHLRVRFIDHDHIGIRPSAARKCLRAGDLERRVRIGAPVISLQNTVCGQTVAIRIRAGLVDQRASVADE